MADEQAPKRALTGDPSEFAAALQEAAQALAILDRALGTSKTNVIDFTNSFKKVEGNLKNISNAVYNIKNIDIKVNTRNLDTFSKRMKASLDSVSELGDKVGKLAENLRALDNSGVGQVTIEETKAKAIGKQLDLLDKIKEKTLEINKANQIERDKLQLKRELESGRQSRQAERFAENANQREFDLSKNSEKERLRTERLEREHELWKEKRELRASKSGSTDYMPRRSTNISYLMKDIVGGFQGMSGRSAFNTGKHGLNVISPLIKDINSFVGQSRAKSYLKTSGEKRDIQKQKILDYTMNIGAKSPVTKKATARLGAMEAKTAAANATLAKTAVTAMGVAGSAFAASALIAVGAFIGLAAASKYATDRSQKLNKTLLANGRTMNTLNEGAIETSKASAEMGANWKSFVENIGDTAIWKTLTKIGAGFTKLLNNITDSVNDANSGFNKDGSYQDAYSGWYTTKAAKNTDMNYNDIASSVGAITTDALQQGFTSKSASNLAVTIFNQAMQMFEKSGLDLYDTAKKLSDAVLSGSDAAKDLGVVMNDNVLTGYAASKGIDIVNVEQSEATLSNLRKDLALEQLTNKNSDAQQRYNKQWEMTGRLLKAAKQQIFSFDEVISLSAINTDIPEIAKPSVTAGGETWGGLGGLVNLATDAETAKTRVELLAAWLDLLPSEVETLLKLYEEDPEAFAKYAISLGKVPADVETLIKLLDNEANIQIATYLDKLGLTPEHIRTALIAWERSPHALNVYLEKLGLCDTDRLATLQIAYSSDAITDLERIRDLLDEIAKLQATHLVGGIFTEKMKMKLKDLPGTPNSVGLEVPDGPYLFDTNGTIGAMKSVVSNKDRTYSGGFSEGGYRGGASDGGRSHSSAGRSLGSNNDKSVISQIVAPQFMVPNIASFQADGGVSIGAGLFVRGEGQDPEVTIPANEKGAAFAKNIFEGLDTGSSKASNTYIMNFNGSMFTDDKATVKRLGSLIRDEIAIQDKREGRVDYGSN